MTSTTPVLRQSRGAMDWVTLWNLWFLHDIRSVWDACKDSDRERQKNQEQCDGTQSI
jgi:hypothetical protein